MVYELHTLKHRVEVSLDTASIALGLAKQDVTEAIHNFGWLGSYGNGPEPIVCVEVGTPLKPPAIGYLQGGGHG